MSPNIPQQSTPVQPGSPQFQGPIPPSQGASGGSQDWLHDMIGNVMGGLSQGGVQAQNIVRGLAGMLGGQQLPSLPSLPNFDYNHRAQQGNVPGTGLAATPEHNAFGPDNYIRGQVDAYMKELGERKNRKKNK